MVGTAATPGMVVCLECNPQKEFKSLGPHVARLHLMSLDQYRAKHTADGTGKDVDVGYLAGNQRQLVANTTDPNLMKTYDAETSVDNNLSPSERAVYKARYDLLFRQADEDEALTTHIRDIVLGEINVSRYQGQISRLTSRITTGLALSKTDADTLDTLTKLVKQTQDQNLKTMDSLNLTRAKKQKNSVSLETTASRFVSAYERWLGNLTPEQLGREMREEEASLKRLHDKAKMLRDLAPREVVIE